MSAVCYVATTGFFYNITTRLHASAVYSIVVCLSVTSQCSAETAKRRITQTTPHNSPGTLVFWRWNLGKTQTWPPPMDAPNAGGYVKIGEFLQITHDNSKTSKHCQLNSVASLSHWASTFVCSTFAVMQVVTRVRQWQLILVSVYWQVNADYSWEHSQNCRSCSEQMERVKTPNQSVNSLAELSFSSNHRGSVKVADTSEMLLKQGAESPSQMASFQQAENTYL